VTGGRAIRDEGPFFLRHVLSNLHLQSSSCCSPPALQDSNTPLLQDCRTAGLQPPVSYWRPKTYGAFFAPAILNALLPSSGCCSRLFTGLTRVVTGHVTGRCSEKARLYWFVTVSRLRTPGERNHQPAFAQKLPSSLRFDATSPQYRMAGQVGAASAEESCFDMWANVPIMSHINLRRFFWPVARFS
jgi:hypothetical protein